jgi:hypothetical protein
MNLILLCLPKCRDNLYNSVFILSGPSGGVDKMGDTEIGVQNPETMLNDDTDSLLKEDSETSIPLDILDLEVK